MCNTYETFEELIEDEDDPKQLLETFKSKSIKYIVVPLDTIGFQWYPLKYLY